MRKFILPFLCFIHFFGFSQRNIDSLFSQKEIMNKLGVYLGMYPTYRGLHRDSHRAAFSDYDFVWQQDKDLYVVKKLIIDGKRSAHLESWLVDGNGKKISKKYTDIGDFHDGLAEASNGNNCSSCYPDRYSFVEHGLAGHGFINKKGKEVIPLRYRYVSKFSEGFACAFYWGRRWFYIDTNGKQVFNKDFHEASDFHNGLAEVTLHNGKENVIDRKGELLIPKSFLHIQPYEAGKIRAFRTLDNKVGFWDAIGNIIIKPTYDDYKYAIWNNCNLVSANGKHGLIDAATGQQRFTESFDAYSYDFRYTHFWLKKNGTWHKYDTLFNNVLSVTADKFVALSATTAMVLRNGGWQLIDTHNGKTLSASYRQILSPGTNLLMAFQGQDGKFGYMDSTGKTHVQPIYDKIEAFSKDRTTRATDAIFLYQLDESGHVLKKQLNSRTSNFLTATGVLFFLTGIVFILFRTLKK